MGSAVRETQFSATIPMQLVNLSKNMMSYNAVFGASKEALL